MSEIIDGNLIAKNIKLDIKQRINYLYDKIQKRPSLTIISVGEDAASKVYVKHKIVACSDVGISAETIQVKDKDALIKCIKHLNNDEFVDGYILQLPLPPGWIATDYFNLFNPEKDVDVFHPENVGLLVQGNPRFKPCTPHGIQVLLNKSGIKVAGKKVVIINRSHVVGRPLSSMLIQECDDYANATVTVCHDRTPPELLKEMTKLADIVIVAVGKPGFLTADMLKEGVVVIDVGITRLENKIVGDVDENVKNIASAVSPVPGGVGPMTVTMLLQNTLSAFERKHFTKLEI